MNIPQVKASVYGANGESSRLADEFVARLLEQHPGAERVVRDLAADPVPHLDGARVAAFFAKPDARTDEQQGIVDYSDRLIEELRSADVLVLGLPMYKLEGVRVRSAWGNLWRRSSPYAVRA